MCAIVWSVGSLILWLDVLAGWLLRGPFYTGNARHRLQQLPTTNYTIFPSIVVQLWSMSLDTMCTCVRVCRQMHTSIILWEQLPSFFLSLSLSFLLSFLLSLANQRNSILYQLYLTLIVYIRMYTCMFVCMYTHMFVCMFVCIVVYVIIICKQQVPYMLTYVCTCNIYFNKYIPCMYVTYIKLYTQLHTYKQMFASRIILCKLPKKKKKIATTLEVLASRCVKNQNCL